jgi:putative SOS response-associated peptidase YedK
VERPIGARRAAGADLHHRHHRRQPEIAWTHDRMPVIPPPSVWGEWPDRGNRDTANLRHLLASVSGVDRTCRPAPARVNDPRNKDLWLVH